MPAHSAEVIDLAEIRLARRTAGRSAAMPDMTEAVPLPAPSLVPVVWVPVWALVPVFALPV